MRELWQQKIKYFLIPSHAKLKLINNYATKTITHTLSNKQSIPTTTHISSLFHKPSIEVLR